MWTKRPGLQLEQQTGEQQKQASGHPCHVTPSQTTCSAETVSGPEGEGDPDVLQCEGLSDTPLCSAHKAGAYRARTWSAHLASLSWMSACFGPDSKGSRISSPPIYVTTVDDCRTARMCDATSRADATGEDGSACYACLNW